MSEKQLQSVNDIIEKKQKSSSQQTKPNVVNDELFQQIAEKKKDAVVYIEAIRDSIFTVPWRIVKFFTGSKSSTFTKLHNLFSRIQSNMSDHEPKVGVSGTGFFIDQDQIVTNIHVIAYANTVAAKQIVNKEIILYSIEGITAFDPSSDLVVLKVDKKCQSPLSIGSSDDVKEEDKVCTLTYANAQFNHITGTILNNGSKTKYHAIKTTLNPGNSGSPILNSNSEVIGIADSAIRALNPETTHTEFAHATHSKYLLSLLKNLIKTEPLHKWQKRPSINAYKINLRADRILHKGKYKKAVNYYDKAISKNPDLVRTYVNRSSAKMKLCDYEGTISDSNIITKLYPGLMNAYLSRAGAYISMYELDTAVKEINRAFENFPNDLQIFKLYFFRAIAYTASGNIDKAVEDINKTVSIRSDFAEGYAIGAKINIQTDNYQDALENTDKAVELRPELELCYSMRSDVKSDFGRFIDDKEGSSIADNYFNEALEDAQKAIQIDPNSTTAFHSRGKARCNLGESYAKSGEVDRAKELYNAAIADHTKAIEIKPISPSPYNGRGWTKYLLGKLESEQGNKRIAKKHFQTAIVDCNEGIRLAKDTYCTYAYYHTRGKANDALGNHQEAIKDFSAAIKHKSIHLRSYEDRAITYEVIGNKTAEKEDWDKVKLLKKDLAVKCLKVGQSKHRDKDYKSAITCFDKSIKLKPKYAAAYSNRGMTKCAIGRNKYKKGNKVQAEQHLQDGIADYTAAIKISPEYASAFSNRGNANYSLGKYQTTAGNTQQAKKYYDQALQDLDKAIEYDQYHIKAHRIRGNVMKALGEIKEAEADYKKAKELEASIENHS